MAEPGCSPAGRSSEGGDVRPGVWTLGAARTQDDSSRQVPGDSMLDRSPAREASSASEMCESASMNSPGRGDCPRACAQEETYKGEGQAKGGVALAVLPQVLQEELAGCFQGMVALLDSRLSVQEQAQSVPFPHLPFSRTCVPAMPLAEYMPIRLAQPSLVECRSRLPTVYCQHMVQCTHAL